MGTKGAVNFKLAINLFAYGVVGILSALLIMLLAGDTFAFILEPLGLYNEKQGIYTDCSDPRNSGSKFCQPKEPRSNRAWRSIKNPVPFSLTDRS
ncbi:MAG: hypothetical protein DCC75_10790 [Proteobacteria bacterium]|nr:MAG: hypothetical protein DCC75_10790 [Pseudomonadota bacterium]